uniref:Uncharacterized protein n=1 Tax=Anguilla anguilla TaxID=7936 RepID=A0A0E9RDK9_ANGAN
MFKWDKLTH